MMELILLINIIIKFQNIHIIKNYITFIGCDRVDSKFLFKYIIEYNLPNFFDNKCIEIISLFSIYSFFSSNSW